MNTRHIIALVVWAIAVVAVVCVVSTTYWQRKQLAFTEAPKVVGAIQAYVRDLTGRGQPLPATVSLRELVSGGYLAASDIRAFDGMEVAISLEVDETRPQDIVIRARLPDGSVVVGLADGSAQMAPARTR